MTEEPPLADVACQRARPHYPAARKVPIPRSACAARQERIHGMHISHLQRTRLCASETRCAADQPHAVCRRPATHAI